MRRSSRRGLCRIATGMNGSEATECARTSAASGFMPSWDMSTVPIVAAAPNSAAAVRIDEYPRTWPTPSACEPVRNAFPRPNLKVGTPPSEAPRGNQAVGDLFRVIRDDGHADPTTDPKLSKDELLSLYRFMLLERTLDNRMLSLQRQGRIGFYGPSLGQEAAIVGAAFAMETRDL